MASPVLRLVVLLSFYVLILDESLAKTVADTAAKTDEVDATKGQNLHRNLADDQVRVLYCTSCGYQQNFNQIKTYLEETFPHLVDRVYGANYDVDPVKMILAQFLGYTQVTAMILLMFGEYLLPAFGMDMALLRWMQNNRIVAFVVIMLMGTAASSLTASGAFEIYFNDNLVFSKLETGRWPTLLEVSNVIGEPGLLGRGTA